MSTAATLHRIQALAAAAFLLLAPVAIAAGAPELERVARSGFTMDMPAWPVEIDRDNGAEGRHVRARPGQRAEAVWAPRNGATIADFDTVIATLEQSHGTRRIERRADQPPGQLRLSNLLEMQDSGWLAMTMVACLDADVYVTIAAGALDREEAERLHAAMLETFRCRAANLPELTQAWPVSDLPDEFGVFMQSSPALAHSDGRWVLIVRLAPSTIEQMRKDAGSAQRVLAVYGQLLGAGWELKLPATELRNLSGPASAWSLDSPELGRMVASAFDCGGDVTGYLLFAGDDTGHSSTAELHTLSTRFGCPDPSQPSILTRPSACEVGAQGFCP